MLFPVYFGDHPERAAMDEEDSKVCVGAAKHYLEPDFRSSEAFVDRVLRAATSSDDQIPGAMRHTMDVLTQYGFVEKDRVCPKCGHGRLALSQGGERNAWSWRCTMSKSHKHFQAKLVSKDPLSKIKSMHLPAFVHFVVCMKTDMRMSKVHACLRDVHGVTSWTTMSQWYIILCI